MSTHTANNVYQIITDRITARLQAGEIPWKQPFRACGNPLSMSTGKPYNGINWLLLSSLGFSSPHFITFKQALDLGGNVKKGEKGFPVVFWKKWSPTAQPNAAGEIDTKTLKTIPLLRYYTVFNVTQCEGLDDKIPQPPQLAQIDPITAAENLIAAMPNRPAITQGGQASYNVHTDEVTMPARGLFISPEAYYSVLFHELTHSTRHMSRLARKDDTEATPGKSRRFGSAAYAREELVAELGAAFLCNACQIDNDHTLENSAAYIQNWLQALKDDPKLVVIAAAQAQKAADYIRGTGIPAADIIPEPAPIATHQPELVLA